jgi:hypothetical protein
MPMISSGTQDQKMDNPIATRYSTEHAEIQGSRLDPRAHQRLRHEHKAAVEHFLQISTPVSIHMHSAGSKGWNATVPLSGLHSRSRGDGVSYKIIVYGRIEGMRDPASNLNAPFRGALYHHNRCAYESFPDVDDSYPYLTRHMFAIASPRLGEGYDRGLIRQILHFGFCQKVSEDGKAFVNMWLDKLESTVLQSFVWKSVVAHFEHELSGRTTVEYSADDSSLDAIRNEFLEVGARVQSSLRWCSSRESPD